MRTALVPFLLLLLTACSGGGGGSSATPSPTAKGLSYSDPSSGTFQLRRNAALSAPGHLVLELWGPSSMACGVVIHLAVDPKQVSWVPVGSTDPAQSLVQPGTVFNLGTGPQILKAQRSGGQLQVAIAEKGLSNPKAMNGPLVRIALEPAAASLPSGTPLGLTADASRSRVLLADGNTLPLTATVGLLKAE